MFTNARILIVGLAITSLVGSGPTADAMEDVAPSVVACTQIKTAAQLQAMQNHLANAYCLAKDIDLSGIANFVPIGDFGNGFTGRLYGNNHVISNLTINNGPGTFVGLFGFIDGAVIQDLALVNAKVIGPHTGAGALVGRAGASSTPSRILRVSVTGQVNCASSPFCGGLAGFLEHDVTLTQASSAAEVTVGNSSSTVGGLAGRNEGTVQQSYATGPVTAGGGNFVGGLIGYSNGGTVQQSYAAGPVTIVLSNSVVGGLVGLQNGGTVAESYAVAPVSAVPGTTLGGLIGAEQNTPAVSNAY
jgi:hypothetical protein